MDRAFDAPLCRTCGGLVTNPSATQCRFCGQALQGGPGLPYRPSGAPQANLAYQNAVNMGGRTPYFALRIAVISVAIALSAVASCIAACSGE